MKTDNIFSNDKTKISRPHPSPTLPSQVGCNSCRYYVKNSVKKRKSVSSYVELLELRF